MRPPYHHDAAASFRRRTAAGLTGLAAVLLLLAGPAGAVDGVLLSPPRALALQQDRQLTIVDVRTPQEWRATGIPSGAARVALDPRRGDRDFLARIEAIAKGDRAMPLALICASGTRSAYAARLLRQRGYANVADIGEGVLGGANGAGWRARGLPMTPCPAC